MECCKLRFSQYTRRESCLHRFDVDRGAMISRIVSESEFDVRASTVNLCSVGLHVGGPGDPDTVVFDPAWHFDWCGVDYMV